MIERPRVRPRNAFRLSAALAAIGIICVGAFGCGGSNDEGSDSSNVIRIGLEAPLSGDQSTLGKGMLQGAQLAAAQINEDGGLLGKKVQIVNIDDAADAKKGVEAANAAVEKDLSGVVGPYNSSVGIETLPIYIDQGLVPIRLTSDDATNGLGYTLQPMSYQIAPVTSDALTKYLPVDKVAIAYDKTQIYTKTVSKAVKEQLEKAGVEVTAYEPIEPGAKDYTSEVRQLAATGADAIYAAVYYPEGALMAKAVNEEGVDARCLLDYASYDSGYVQDAGVEAAKACGVIGVPAPDDFANSDSYVRDFQREFDAPPGTWSPYTYDSLNFLAYGIRKAGGTDPDKIADVLNDVSGWKGWTGTVKIDPKNGNRQPATVTLDYVDDQGNFHVDEEWARAVGAPY